jgi:hypothetical protein
MRLGMQDNGWRQRVDARPQAMLEAKDLPHCDLSEFLEAYVDKVIREERIARAKSMQCPVEAVSLSLTFRHIQLRIQAH